jgi:hypothetical protein
MRFQISPLKYDIIVLPVRKGDIGLAISCNEAPLEYIHAVNKIINYKNYINFLVIQKYD